MLKRFFRPIHPAANHRNLKNKLLPTIKIAAILLICSLVSISAAKTTGPIRKFKNLPVGFNRWWKGNLHAHSFWSDGDHFPETIAAWYKFNGYHFLAFSEHNKLQEGENWIGAIEKPEVQSAFRWYLENFSHLWVKRRLKDKQLQVRLNPLYVYRHLLEEPDRFMLMQAEEVTQKQAHLNVINIRNPIPKQQGSTPGEVMQKTINLAQAQQKETGRPMLTIINHPNHKWRITAEDIIPIKDARYLEIYNGHPAVQNYGDKYHASTERMWDIILTKRLAELNLPVIYGVATDDAHKFQQFGPNSANPGRGWVGVKAVHLTPEAIVEAMEAGDFYASTGVKISTLSFNGRAFHVAAEPEEGVSYTIQFIGTLKGYDPTSKPVVDENGVEIRATRTYSPDIGKVLKEVKKDHETYTCTGREIYVRAKIITDKPQTNPYAAGDVEVAWTQPVIPKVN
jgi:hypothetical protein